MGKAGRYAATELALLTLLICLGKAARTANGQQNGAEGGAIVVDGGGMRERLPNVPVTVRVRCPERQINLAITVESVSQASFSDLPSGEYVVQITAEGYQGSQLKVSVSSGETVNISADVDENSLRGFALRRDGAAGIALPAPLDASWLSGADNGAKAVKTEETGAKAIKTEETGAKAIKTEEAGTKAIRAEETKACPVEGVVQGASKRLEEFVENVNRVTAIEVLEHERLDRHGKVLEREKHKFNYVAIVEQTAPGQLNVDEYRDGGLGANGGFPHDIATVGMPSLAMIFHPFHLGEFEMACEGTATWRERNVWQVRFQQRKDRPARMSDFRIGGKLVPVLLKGMAWIDTANYQIVHLETDLMAAMPEVKLYIEHQALDYGPVNFGNPARALWLPQHTEIYLESSGRRFRHRHTYSDYRIFSVEVGQKIGSPQ
jgi:hypothetical protein